MEKKITDELKDKPVTHKDLRVLINLCKSIDDKLSAILEVASKPTLKESPEETHYLEAIGDAGIRGLLDQFKEMGIPEQNIRQIIFANHTFYATYVEE